MEILIDRIMNDADVKSKYSQISTSSVTSNEDTSMLDLFDQISSRKANFLEVILGLEKYHTEGDPEQRTKAINVIAGIIHEVPNLGLDSKAIAGLVEFFTKKFKDEHCILPSLRGMHALLKFHSQVVKQSQRDGEGCLRIVINSLSPGCIHIPSYKQKIRSEALRLLETLLNKYNEFFKLQEENMNEVDLSDSDIYRIPYVDIISCVVSAIDNEKDPRNLLVSFELPRILLFLLGKDEHSFKTLEPFCNDIFENIASYYPIEFEPPK